MYEVKADFKAVNIGQLQTELDAALPGKALGVSTYGLDRPISIYLVDGATPDDIKAAQSVFSAHAPAASKAPPPTVTDLQAQLDSVQQQLNSLKASQQPA